MFGLFKSKRAPSGPVDIIGSVDILRPAAQVYAMMDWSSDDNAKVAMGWFVTPVEGTPDRFEMVMPHMPQVTFDILVHDAEPNRLYSFDCAMCPQMSALLHNHERYEIERLGENSCRVTLTCTSIFEDELSRSDYDREVTMMTTAVQSSLKKFKLQAEHGAEVAASLAEDVLL